MTDLTEYTSVVVLYHGAPMCNRWDDGSLIFETVHLILKSEPQIILLA